MPRRLFFSGLMAAGLAQPALAQTARPVARDNDLFSAEAAARFEAMSGGRLGVAVLDFETGRQAAFAANQRFPLNSTVKFLIAGLILREADRGTLRLSDTMPVRADDIVPWSPSLEDRVGTDITLEALCRAALQTSDNAAFNFLARRLGGPGACTDALRELGDAHTRIDRLEPQLNMRVPGTDLDTTTPAAMLAHLNHFLLGDTLTAESRATLIAWMEGNRTGDRRIRAGVPAEWRVADRTGTSTQGDSACIALIRRPERAPVLMTIYMSETGLPMRSMDPVHAAIADHIALRLAG